MGPDVLYYFEKIHKGVIKPLPLLWLGHFQEVLKSPCRNFNLKVELTLISIQRKCVNLWGKKNSGLKCELSALIFMLIFLFSKQLKQCS